MIPVLLILAAFATTDAHKRVCYYSNWSQYRIEPAKFFPEDIDPFLCTHIIYSFANLVNDQLSTWEENDEDLYRRFNGLKGTNPNLKTLLAVGGWSADSASFSTLSASLTLRKNFARTSVTYLRRYGFDGLDMDWEYPALRGGRPEDKANFVLLLKDLKEEFEREQEDTGLPRLLLTVAVAAGKSNIDTAYDIPGMNKNLDFINLMSYDLHGGWERFTGHHAPLVGQDPQDTSSVDWSARYWRDNGTPADKLIIGLATYGRSFQLANPNNNGMGAPAVGQGGAQGPYTATQGFMAYYEVCLKLSRNEGTRIWDTKSQVPYLVDGNQWIGYDDVESITLKLRYIKDNNYGGAMVWNIDLDDFQMICNQSTKNYPLMSLMKTVLDAPTTNPPTTQSPGSSSTDSQTDGPTTTSNTDEPTTTTTEEPRNTNRPTNPPNTEFCSNRADGLYPDPLDCNKFYQCWSRRTYHKSCPPDTVFNPNRNYCDHAFNYDCQEVTTQNPTTTTGEPTEPPTTEEPTEPPTTREPTELPTTEEPTDPTTTEEPTESTITEEPTETPTTEETTETPKTEEPTQTPTTPPSPPTAVPGQPDPNFCEDKYDGLYKMDVDCSKYYHCAHGITYLFSCIPGTLFSASAKHCDWAANVDCSDPGPLTEYCRGLSDGLYWYPDDCARYYSCWSGTTYIYTCPAGTFFDSELSNCLHRDSVDCKGAPDK